jgi:hypothetical protein
MSKTAGMFNIQTGSASSARVLEKGEIILPVTAGNPPVVKGTKYTKSDISDLLVGYVSIAEKKWEALDHGTHVRYNRTDGRFVRGGFVSGYSKQNGRRMLTLANGFNATDKGYTMWTIGLDSIKQLYVKKTAVPSSKRVDAAPHTVTENTALRKIIADLKARLEKLEADKSIKK